VTLVANKLIALDKIPVHTLREKDRLECLAGGLSPEQAVRRSVAGADRAFATYVDEDVLCLWGYRVEDVHTNTIVMWLLTTDLVFSHKMIFARESLRTFKLISMLFSKVSVLVHNDYADAIKWLEWLGFKKLRVVNQHFSTYEKERL
jgi:hypothetical protein